MNFEVSVIIPVYNASKYLEKAVGSVINLSEVIEVLLIEDGSIDNSLEICIELEKLYDKVKLLRHTNGLNKGAGASRNLGLKNASSKFISFLDADDFFLPHRFWNAKEIFQKDKNIEGVFEAIGTHFYSEKAKEIYRKGTLTTLNEDFLIENGYFTTLVCGRGFTHLNGLTLRRSILDKGIQFDESLIQSQDADFLYSLAIACNMQPGNLKKPVAMRGVHETNRIHNVQKANIYANKLSLKWIKKAKTAKWKNRIIYNLVTQYLETSKSSKPIAMLKLLIKQPFLVLRFNIFDFLKRLI